MDSVLVYGGKVVDADKQAVIEAQSEKLPNSDLLHVRLLFDGGYYARAEKILNGMKGKKLSPEVSLECAYRYGRIADKQSRIPDAKIWYKRTLKEGENSQRYFAANASLMLGRLYESEDSLKLASHYYQTCLNLNFDEYHNSICGEAKESLARLQNK
jgi:tetratricopeptide (TPR) repeat protein